MRESAGDLLEEDPHLHPGEVVAHALVAAVAEREVIAALSRWMSNSSGVLEMAAVAVGRRLTIRSRALRDRHAADGGVGGGHAAPRDDRPRVAQALLDRVGDQRGIGADLVPHARAARAAGGTCWPRRGGGLMRGNDARHHHRVQVAVGDDLRLFLWMRMRVLHPAVAGRVLPHLVEHLPGVLPELADVRRPPRPALRARGGPRC